MSAKQHMSRDSSQGLLVSNAANTECVCLSYSLYLLDLQLVLLCLLLYLANPVAITAVVICGNCTHSGLLGKGKLMRVTE